MTISDDLSQLYPVGTIMTIEGRLPEPARLEAVPTRTGNYIQLKVVSAANPDNATYRTLLLPYTEFVAKVRIVARPGERSFDAPAAQFRLALEAERLRLAYAYDPHFAVSVSNIDALPHQIDAVYHHMLKMARVRFLLADDPGAGKTVMAGLLMKELKIRKVVSRVLIVTPAGLTTQWVGEMQQKFDERFHVISRGTVNDNLGHNIWQEYTQVITSIDFAKQDSVLAALDATQWDLVIVDEAHKMSAYRSGQNRKATGRYRLGETLAKANNLLLMTATPHKGDPYNFAYLLQLIDRDLFDMRQGATINGLTLADRARTVVLRRQKEELKGFDGKPLYPPRTVTTQQFELSAPEKALYDAVTRYVLDGLRAADEANDRAAGFVLMGLQRRVASSLEAIDHSLKNRRTKLHERLTSGNFEQTPAPDDDWDDEDDEDAPEAERWAREERYEGATTARSRPDIEREILVLNELIGLADAVRRDGHEAKFDALRSLLEDAQHPVIGGSEKLIIFTENKDTLDYLAAGLHQRFGLNVLTIHGDVPIPERKRVEERFKDPAQDYQVLVATEAAGEGINLQVARLLFNYDIPWNPNRLEQRMGRVHRYLQKRPVYIYNFVANNTREGEVMVRLLDKLDRMRDDLGGDKVFDVIGTLIEDMSLDLKKLLRDAIRDDYAKMAALNVIDEAFKTRARDALKHASEDILASTLVDYNRLADEEERSRLARIAPEASERFFLEACRTLGIRYERRGDGLWRIPTVPATLRNFAAEAGMARPAESYIRFTFYKTDQKDDSITLMSPTHPLFDAIVARVRDAYTDLLPKGAVFGVPGATASSALWFYRGRVTDGSNETVGEKVFAVRTDSANDAPDPNMVYNPSAFVDLTAPALPPPLPDDVPVLLATDDVAMQVVTEHGLEPYLMTLAEQRQRNVAVIRSYNQQQFQALIADANKTLSDQQRRQRQGERMDVAIHGTRERLDKHIADRNRRLREIELDSSVSMALPELLGVALCLPLPVPPHLEDVLTDDPDVEAAAVAVMTAYEERHGRKVYSRERENVGYDFDSYEADDKGGAPVRYIEVKGRSSEGIVALTPNEWDTARRLGPDYWLYIVTNATSDAPKLWAIPDPTTNLQAVEEEVSVTRYIVRVAEYKRATHEETL